MSSSPFSSLDITYDCPKCKGAIQGPFPPTGHNCGFNILGLAGIGTSSFQQKKWNQHTGILYGRNVSLYGKEFNASFDYNGYAQLKDLVQFTIMYGDRAQLPSTHGNHTNDVILSYVPEVIGSGTSIHSPGNVPCSGLCLISPGSSQYAHSFPVLDEWVQQQLNGHSSSCRICGGATSFAQPICAQCYRQHGDWRLLV